MEWIVILNTCAYMEVFIKNLIHMINFLVAQQNHPDSCVMHDQEKSTWNKNILFEVFNP